MKAVFPTPRISLPFLNVLICLLAWPLVAHAELLPIRNDSVWRDTDGREITAQGGSIMKQGDTWYWYGFEGEPPPPKSGIPVYRSVKCYTSKDLSKWKCEGVIFDDAHKVPNRLDVIFCPATRKYVMISKHMDFKQGVGISTSDTPAGKFTWQGWAALPDSLGGGDQSVFIDDDGKAYLVYTPWRRDDRTGKIETNRHLTCAELTGDYCRVARIVCQIKDTRLEAPAIFKRNGRYYWMASSVAWWYSSPTSWCTASKLEGPWTPFKKLESTRPASDPLAQQALRDCYNSQHDFVMPVQGSAGTFYMFCGDRYSNYTTFGVGRNVWLPLQWNADTPMLDWHPSWQIDADKGTWAPGPNPIPPANPVTVQTTASPAIVLDRDWNDTAGREMCAQGGCVIQAGKLLYCYGVEYEAQSPRKVHCYSSADLVNWKYEQPVLIEHVSRRVKVLPSPDGKQFFMFGRDGTTAAVAVSANPAGPFAPRGAIDLPGAVAPGDVSTFTDDDGKSYLVYNAGAAEKDTIIVAELKSDFTAVARVTQQFKDVSRDNPSLWKHAGIYYCTAGDNKSPWYAASGVSYTSAPALQGPWKPWKPINGVSAGGNARHNLIFSIKGAKDTLLVYWGDRYSQFTQFGVGKQVWLPLFFNEQTPSLLWCRPWYPNVSEGTFKHDLRRYGLWRDLPK